MTFFEKQIKEIQSKCELAFQSSSQNGFEQFMRDGIVLETGQYLFPPHGMVKNHYVFGNLTSLYIMNHPFIITPNFFNEIIESNFNFRLCSKKVLIAFVNQNINYLGTQDYVNEDILDLIDEKYTHIESHHQHWYFQSSDINQFADILGAGKTYSLSREYPLLTCENERGRAYIRGYWNQSLPNS